MNKQESQYKIINDYFIYKEVGSDALGLNYRAGEIIPENRKAEKHVLITEVYPFLYRNPSVWKKVNTLLEGVKKSNIPKLFSPEKIIQEGDKAYLVYPHLSGKTFEQVLEDSAQNDQPINFDLAFAIIFAIADLIDIGSSIVVSREKSFHGFLTPDNILIDYDGKILLKNYGIYPYLKEEEVLTELEKKYGAWLAPELLRKERPVCQTDIYYMGYITYRILTGKYFSCSPDEDFDSKFSNISFTQHIPSSDKEFLTSLITFFKKTLHPQPSKRYSNIKEFKDFISSQFHIEELSSITFNLAYFMNSLYLQNMEDENKILTKELAYTLPEEKKPEPIKADKANDHLVEDILTGLDNQKSSKMKLIIPLVALIVVIVVIAAYVVINQQKQVDEQKAINSQATQNLQRDFAKWKADMEAANQLKLKELEAKAAAATTEQEKRIREEEIRKVKEEQKETLRKATEAQKIEEERIKKQQDDQKKLAEEAEAKKKEDERIQKQKEDLKKKEEAAEAQRKKLEEVQTIKEGQLINYMQASEKPKLLSQETLRFSPIMMKKYKGIKTFARFTLLVDENGNVIEVKNIPDERSQGKIQSDLLSVINKSLMKRKYSPAKKDNVKVKVWTLPFDFEIDLTN